MALLLTYFLPRQPTLLAAGASSLHFLRSPSPQPTSPSNMPFSALLPWRIESSRAVTILCHPRRSHQSPQSRHSKACPLPLPQTVHHPPSQFLPRQLMPLLPQALPPPSSPSVCPSPVPSPTPDAQDSEAQSEGELRRAVFEALSKKGKGRKRKKNSKDRANDCERKKARRSARRGNSTPDLHRPPTKHRSPLPAINTALPPEPAVSTGYTGKRVDAIRHRHIWGLDELKQRGFRVVEWDWV